MLEDGRHNMQQLGHTSSGASMTRQNSASTSSNVGSGGWLPERLRLPCNINQSEQMMHVQLAAPPWRGGGAEGHRCLQQLSQ